MQDILIKILMWIIETLSGIFITPVMWVVQGFLPDMSQGIAVCQTFLEDYAFKGALIAKQVFVNCTGVSQVALKALFTYLALKVAMWTAMLTYKLIIAIWKLVKP